DRSRSYSPYRRNRTPSPSTHRTRSGFDRSLSPPIRRHRLPPSRLATTLTVVERFRSRSPPRRLRFASPQSLSSSSFRRHSYSTRTPSPPFNRRRPIPQVSTGTALVYEPPPVPHAESTTLEPKAQSLQSQPPESRP